MIYRIIPWNQISRFSLKTAMNRKISSNQFVAFWITWLRVKRSFVKMIFRNNSIWNYGILRSLFFGKNSVKSTILRNISLTMTLLFATPISSLWNQFANFLHPRKLIDTLTSLYCFLPKLISLSLAIILKTLIIFFTAKSERCS